MLRRGFNGKSIMVRVCILGVVLIIVGIITMADAVGDKAAMAKGIKDINSLSAQDFELNTFVEGDLEMIYDEFAYLETSDSTFGIKYNTEVTKHYYVVPLAGAENGQLIAVEIGNKDASDTATKMVDALWAMLSGEDFNESDLDLKLHVMGKVVKMGKDEEKLYHEWLDEFWFDEGEDKNYAAVTSPYMIQYYAAGTAGTGLSVSIGIIAVGAAILVVFAILLIKTGKAAARQPETYYPSNGPAPSSFGNSQDDLMAQMEASRMANEQYGSMDDTGYKPAHAASTGTVDLGKNSSASGMDGLDTSYFNNSGDVSSIGNYLDDNK